MQNWRNPLPERYTIEVVTNKSRQKLPSTGQWHYCDEWLDIDYYQVVSPTPDELVELQNLAKLCTTENAANQARQGMSPHEIAETDRMMENGEWHRCTFLDGYREAAITKQPANYDLKHEVITVEEAKRLLQEIADEPYGG